MPNLSKIAFALVCGLYFAILQFSYFFLMEAYLSSQYLSYFVTLFFWLCGFLIGLAIRGESWFTKLLCLGAVMYYVAWGLARWVPFSAFLYPSAAACSIVSGLLPGYFFPFMARRFQSVGSLLFHENNGFILGILISLKASIYCGRWFLALGPLLGALLVFVVQMLSGAARMDAVVAPASPARARRAG